MSDTYKVTGQLVQIREQRTFESGSTKGEFLVRTGGQYSQDLCFEVWDEGVLQVLQPSLERTEVTVYFDIRSREYKGRYFTDLVCWRLTASKRIQPQKERQPQQAFSGDDEIPF